MKHRSFLVYGTELFMKEEIDFLRSHLVSCGSPVEVFSVNENFFAGLQTWLQEGEKDELLLICISCHGSVECLEGGITYESLAKLLSRVRNRILIVNYACYGFELLRHLKILRSESSTGFIAPGDAESISSIGCIRSLAVAWSKRLLPENYIAGGIVSVGGRFKVSSLPTVKRWGVTLDQNFF